MKLLTKVTAIFDKALGGTAFLAAALLAFVTLSVTYEVVMRYFLGRPTVWVFEITEVSLLYFTFLGAAWVLKRDGHVKIEVVLNRLKPRAQALVNIITSSFGTIAWLIIIYFGSRATWQAFQMGLHEERVLAIPNAAILVIIPVGGLFLFGQSLIRTSGYLGSWKALRHKLRDI